jgi:hypothetical protein
MIAVCSAKDFADLAADRLVGLEARFHEDQVRTLVLRRDRQHRRSNPELSCFVARSGHDAELRRTAHCDWLAAELRMVALFHGRVERIHVDVDDLAIRRRREASFRIGRVHVRIIQTSAKQVAVGWYLVGLAFRTSVADRPEHLRDRDGRRLGRDAGGRILTGDVESALASVRVGAVLHPAVLVAFGWRIRPPTLILPSPATSGSPSGSPSSSASISLLPGTNPSAPTTVPAANTDEGFRIAVAPTFPRVPRGLWTPSRLGGGGYVLFLGAAHDDL